MYLRCLILDRPRNWLEWLPWAEFYYNSSYQQSLKTSPFEVVYGRPPPSIRSYEHGDARLPAVDRAMKDRDAFFWQRSEIGWNRRSSITRPSMIVSTDQWNFPRGSGSGSAYYTGR
jgi:hypothetical protein